MKKVWFFLVIVAAIFLWPRSVEPRYVEPRYVPPAGAAPPAQVIVPVQPPQVQQQPVVVWPTATAHIVVQDGAAPVFTNPVQPVAVETAVPVTSGGGALPSDGVITTDNANATFGWGPGATATAAPGQLLLQALGANTATPENCRPPMMCAANTATPTATPGASLLDILRGTPTAECRPPLVCGGQP